MLGSDGKIALWDCNNSVSELFDINYWSDTGHLLDDPEVPQSAGQEDVVPAADGVVGVTGTG
ncbi:hypothetical protein [Streptomyces sp. cg40]|uniref:hypothetical protein n=1 Tax=Streptomyces sp. cg40 TaxID=3419764 RepID=UPI003D049C75